jgi:hypothetical protein
LLREIEDSPLSEDMKVGIVSEIYLLLAELAGHTNKVLFFSRRMSHIIGYKESEKLSNIIFYDRC